MNEVADPSAALALPWGLNDPPLPLFFSFNAARQRRNNPALIPSRRQNSAVTKPLLVCRRNSSRHIAALRFTRLFVIAGSSDQHQNDPIRATPRAAITPSADRLRLEDFKRFAKEHPERMKYPDTRADQAG